MNTTLSDINPNRDRYWHVYVEYRGMRYYVGSAIHLPEAESIGKTYGKRGLSAYVTDKNDSTSINGWVDDLELAITIRKRNIGAC